MQLKRANILIKLLTAAMLLAWRPLILAAEGGERWLDCIDFANLTNSATCTCYSGTVDNPMAQMGVVDRGSSNEESRHTVHTSSSETDPRTGSNLHTVPAGEPSSVRLGSWIDGDWGGAIEYAYTPTLEDGDMLILRYAVVFDTPRSGHEENELPHFMLQVLDDAGNPLGTEPCFFADFRPQSISLNALTDGWHTHQYMDPDTHKPVMIVWKEWTTVFFSLRDHVGEPLRIRLQVQNCSLKEHFAYAYFTIHCERAAFYGLDCGMPSTHFEAPVGFDYRWYKKSAPEATIGTEHILDLQAGDTAVYCVDILSKTGCSITLEADPQPDLTPQLELAIDSLFAACADGDWMVPFTIAKGSCDSVVLIAQRKAIQAGFHARYVWRDGDPQPWTIDLPDHTDNNAMLRVGSYPFILKPYSSEVVCGEPAEQEIVLQLRYPSFTTVQRGSYIFLKNAANNGGYEFAGCTFQWYQNGEPVQGATSSQLCVGDAPAGSEFYCVITDTWGNVAATCPKVWQQPVFTGVADQESSTNGNPSRCGFLLQQGQTIRLADTQSAYLYDAAGRLILSAYDTAGNLQIAAPQAGVYILKADTYVTRVIVK